MSPNQLPPHSIESEQGVLGCCLLDPVPCLTECAERLHGGAEAFYDLRHQHIYETMAAMLDRLEPVDLITLQEKLRGAGVLEQVGGLAYLAQLPDKTPSAANIGYYVSILREKFILRRLLRAATDLVAKVQEHTGDVAPLMDHAERSILQVGGDAFSVDVEKSQKDNVRAAITAIEQRHGGAMTGLLSGFHKLDEMTGGLQKGDMIVIAARPSVGKSSLAFQMALESAQNGIPVGFFSLEMSASALNQRAIGTIAGVNVRRGHWNEGDMRKMTAAATKLSKLPLHIDDRSGLRMAQIRAKARRWKQQHRVGLLVIDYLTLIRARNDKQDRRQAVDEISTDVKGLAKELELPVVVLAQLNREIEKGKERKPMMSDLRESGQIEQDADVIGFLYRADTDESPHDPVIAVNLLIAKQRNGALGDIPLTFHRELTRFQARSSIEDHP